MPNVDRLTNTDQVEELTAFVVVVDVKDFFSMTLIATFSQVPFTNASRTSPKAPLTFQYSNIITISSNNVLGYTQTQAAKDFDTNTQTESFYQQLSDQPRLVSWLL